MNLPERYRVVRHIANGGMASVWEAEDETLGRTVAVKVLSAGFAAEPSSSRRFQREARAAARVSVHPNVVTIYDIGEHEGHPFIVMEHLAGGTVAERLRARKPIPRDVALRWLDQAARALDAAHAAGIVHRDVKPANLLLDGDDRLAVADFGIATLAAEATLTQTGDVIGTAAYLSPEQALGKPSTPASDRYALAVVAYELLTGRRPFVADTAAAQMLQHVDADPPAPSALGAGLPSAVDDVMRRGLAKHPDDRPKTARQLVADISSALRMDGRPDSTTRALGLALTLPVRAVGEAMTAPLRAVRGEAAPGPPTARTEIKPAKRVAPLGTVAARPAPGVRPRRRRGGRTALGVAALLVGGALAAFALAGSPRDASSSRGGGGGGTTTTTTTSSKKIPPKGPNDLNTSGYRKFQDGDYEGAVKDLQRSVQGFRDAGATDDPVYAYALFNLAQALRKTGHTDAAIPLLQERATYPDQRATVLAALNEALIESGQAPVGGKRKHHKDKDE